MKQLVILAGGKGSRLKDRLGDLPKPMIPIGGKPLLEHQLELARRHGFTEIVVFVQHRHETIQAYFGDGLSRSLNIRYVVEKEPLGTAGAVLAGMSELDATFAVLYGDVMVNVDIDRIWQRHLARRADATLLLHPNDHPQDSDLVETNGEWIKAFHNRPHPADRWFQNLVNAGLYVMQKSILENFREAPFPSTTQTILDFGKDFFPVVLNRGARLLAYNSPEYIKDIGTPQRHDRICAEYSSGVVQRSSLRTPQRAVFFDRDGTLIPDKDCLRSADELELFPGVAEAVSKLNHAGWRAVIVTNQPVIAKGWCDEAELQRIHNKLESLLGREHAFLDRIYFCPHHPDAGYEGERRELKIHCNCRKPATGMIQSAVDELNIDLSQSWLIGDSTTDLQTAKNAGIKSILVRTGCGGHDNKYTIQPDFVFDSVVQAVDFIIQKAP